MLEKLQKLQWPMVIVTTIFFSITILISVEESKKMAILLSLTVVLFSYQTILRFFTFIKTKETKALFELTLYLLISGLILRNLVSLF